MFFMKLKMNAFIAATILFAVLAYSNSEGIASSVSGMEEMLFMEQKLINTLGAYISENEHKMYVLRRKLEEFKEENSKGLEDPEKYVTNPLSSFKLINRLASDWLDVMYYMQNSTGEVYKNKMKDYILEKGFPTPEDISEAVRGFIRIQSTYMLKPIEVMNGVINEVQYDHVLNSKDLFELGSNAFAEGQHIYADQWLKASLIKYDSEKGEYFYFNFDKETILEKAIDNKVDQKDYYTALRYAEQLLKINRRNSNGRHTVTNMEHAIGFNSLTNKTSEGVPDLSPTDMFIDLGCRGIFDKFRLRLSPEYYCYYETKNHPFLTLAPIKVEVMEESPYMLLFHEVISDKEIAILKRTAKKYLQRSLVFDPVLKISKKSTERTSQYASFDESDHVVFLTLGQRCEDMTGLSLSTKELFQVMNYGIGGHYAKHSDYFYTPDNLDNFQSLDYQHGNRFATMLFYLSDVEQGGFTVFPELYTAIRPKKGSCVFWYNVRPNGEGDPETSHMACPVLVGSKWVCNLWIRSAGQMFIKPCPADYQ